ncbi:hypothetical protein L6452_22047 [Arctium lappa]|uniref:Uncharacterized protein n=1 Tax=Arctium lappa TaxID=4217 RepID=A0ACB9AZL1_ARCLA|nr:hypothetical protein L6452_22047 [Arctium lappa]
MEAKVDQTSFVAETLWNFGTATLRSEGWGHHFVSKRKYHFIIPINNEWIKPLDNGVLDLQTHILHGLIHCNGFGHLLCINGSEGGSNFVRGRDVMELWDRNSSKRRKISVVDTSKKRKMDLRLLYGEDRTPRKFGAAAAENKGRWPVKKLEEVAGVVIGVPKAKIAENGNGNCGISWQVLRDTAGIGNTGLIDHVLSLLDDVTIGGYVDGFGQQNFTKEWLPDDYDDKFLRLICHLLVPTGRRNSVGEQLLIPFNATIGDLKLAAEIALRDTYCVMENLKVSEIVKFEGLSDTEMILDTSLQSGSAISVRGSGVDLLTTSGLTMKVGPGITTASGWWRAIFARFGSIHGAVG